MKTDPHRFDDLFFEFGPIALRRFFGGEGIFSGETMIGMVMGDRVFFKTGDDTIKKYKKEKCRPFTFVKGGTETIVTTWFEVPERLYDDPEELANWARDALKIAETSPTAVQKKRKAAEAHMPSRERKKMQRLRARRRSPGR